MGDSACLMHGFSYASAMPNESIQGYHKHALGDSISFGRFMTDQSLSWDKWSTFSHKKYVEEAERYAQPGSVAQKKAFFEAHYKRIAAQKAAALLEQENADKTEAEGVRNDNNAYVEEQRDNLNSDVDVKMEVVKIQDAKKDLINEPENHAKNSVATEDIPLKTTIQRKTWEIPSTPPKQVHLKQANNVNRSKTGPKWHILSAICSKSSTACRNKLQSPNRSTSFNLRTEERAAKGKQEKAGNKLRKLSCTFCFKARRPLPDENEAPKDQMKKVVRSFIMQTTAAQPQSAVLGTSISNKTQGTISMPPPPPPPTCLAKSTASKNLSKKNVLNQGKILTNSLPERITRENASPNIQQ